MIAGDHTHLNVDNSHEILENTDLLTASVICVVPLSSVNS